VAEHAALKTNASRRHEWKFLADLLDLPGDHYVHFAQYHPSLVPHEAPFPTSQALKDAYLAHFAKSVPGLKESLSHEESLEQDGKISFFELALFLSQQPCLRSFRLTSAELAATPHKKETVEKLSNALELFATIKREFARLAREVGMPVPPEDARAIYEEAIAFEAFYFVMAIDESEMEAKEGDHGLATNLFNMVDCALLADDEEGDGGISRDELRKAFEGLPKLSSHAVEEFLFLFDLNHMGEIERHSFVEEAQHLGVLSHRVEAHA